MQLGRAYDKAGKTADALRAFTRIGDEFPDSPYAGDAKSGSRSPEGPRWRGLSCAVSHGIVGRRRHGAADSTRGPSRKCRLPGSATPQVLGRRAPDARAFSVVLADDPVSSGRRLLAGLARFDLDPIVAHAVSAADAMALLGVAPCDLLVVGALHPDHLAERLLERVGHDGAAPPLVVRRARRHADQRRRGAAGLARRGLGLRRRRGRHALRGGGRARARSRQHPALRSCPRTPASCRRGAPAIRSGCRACRRWRRSAGSPAASRTTSTTSSRRSAATRELLQESLSSRRSAPRDRRRDPARRRSRRGADAAAAGVQPAAGDAAARARSERGGRHRREPAARA